MLLLRCCFMATGHILGHFGRSQLTYPHCSWASLLNSLPVLSARSFTSNCPSWISGRERIAVEIISWPNSTKECCRTWGSNPRPSAYQADSDLTELLRPAINILFLLTVVFKTLLFRQYWKKVVIKNIKTAQMKPIFYCFLPFFWMLVSFVNILT